MHPHQEKPQNKHKQRRRKSKGQKLKNVQPPTNLGTYKKPTGKPKQEFIDEEKEIRKLIDDKKLSRSESGPTPRELEIMFFESAIPPDSDEIADDRETSSVKTGESLKSLSNMPESPTHLASSYLAPDEGIAIRKFVPEIVEYDEDLLFFPALEEEIDLETELKSQKTSKLEEGLFEFSGPTISRMNRAQMINRCLEEKNVDCLKIIENGPSAILDLPRHFLRLEKLYKSHSEKKFHPVLVKAEPVWKVLNTYEAINKTLNIFIHSIVFDEHPNLNEHLGLIKKIKTLFAEYLHLMELDEVTKLRSKLEGLRSVKEQMTSDDPKMGVCKAQIKETRNELHKKAKKRKNLILQLLEAWRQLKINNKNPEICLKITCIDANLEEEQRKWDENFQIELNEVAEEAFDEYFIKRQEYKSKSTELRIEKPRKPDIEGIRDDLQLLWYDSYQLPGEPEVLLELQTTVEGTLRKGTGLKYFIKIFADNELVTVTKPKELLSDSKINFDTIFAVRLTTRMVKDLRMEVFEISGIKSTHKIAEIFSMMPAQDDDFAEIEVHEFEFATKKIRGHRMNGKLRMKCGWVTSNQQENEVQGSSAIEIRMSQKQDVISQDMYKSWHQQHLIDPLDPDSHKVVRTLHETHDSRINPQKEEKYFNLNEEALAFCSQEEMDGDERLNMLRRRFERDLKYKNAIFVPSDQRELEIPEQENIFEEIVGDPIDIQRHEGKKYLKKVYETIANYCDNLNASREDSAILIGDQVPTFGSLSLTFFEIFGAKRPLKPTRRTPSSSKSGRTIELQGNFSIVVTIVRAFGVPQRNEDVENSRRNSNLSVTNKSLKGSNVRPFVSISLKDKNVRTCTAEGFNPTWNEQLSISVNSKTDLNKSTLSVDLFDECIDDLSSGDDRRITEISQRWLGQLQFPLETIYQNQRIEGTFEMNTPTILLGYNRQSFDTSESAATLKNVGIPNMREVTYLSLFINIEPPLDVPLPLTTIGLECIELEETKNYIDNWYVDLRNEFPKAPNQTPYVLLQSGKKACVTRLLGALEIPNFEPSPDASLMELYVRRFVSLIPVYSSFNQCNGLEGVWLTNEQIFNVICASPKDLGVLLTCYFLTLKLNAWLILGHGIPMGDTCFVLLKEDNEYFIVDPTTGKKYESTTVDCPLKKVYALANAENFWANIQREKRVFMTLFDVKSSVEWKPLFKSGHKAPPGFLHNTAFQYKKSHPVFDLQRTIELKLTKKISAWRTHRKTTWNRYVTEHLRKILIELETETVLWNFNNEKHLHNLGRMFSNYKVTGFPLNFRYTNLSTIVHHIKCTGIHLTSENSEFALAVHVKEYPNNMISVWIFLASMTTK